MIAAYDPLPELGEQLDALNEQSYDGALEVIVSDNGGDEALRDYVARHPAKDRLGLRWVDSSQRRGTAFARTVGARAGTHDFIAYTDQDDRVHPGWLDAMTETAAFYDLVGGKLDQLSLNDPTVVKWRDVSSVDELPTCAGFLPFASGCNFGIWRDAFEDIDGWDAEFVPGEDIDICWRAQLRGHTLGYSPDAVVAYRFRTTIMATYRQSVFYQDGEARLMKRYHRDGAERRSVLIAAVHATWVVVRCPLFPGNWSREHRGKWAFHAGIVVGRIRGSLKYRVFYP